MNASVSVCACVYAHCSRQYECESVCVYVRACAHVCVTV